MIDHSDDKPDRGKSPSRFSAICIAVIALLVLYVLSSGPAMLLEDRLETALAQDVPGGMYFTTPEWPRKVVDTLYSPLCRLSGSETVDGVFSKYFQVLGMEYRYYTMKKDRAQTLLQQARIAIKNADFDAAVETAIYVRELDLGYRLFDDRPEYVLDEIERLKRLRTGGSPQRAAATGVFTTSN